MGQNLGHDYKVFSVFNRTPCSHRTGTEFKPRYWLVHKNPRTEPNLTSRTRAEPNPSNEGSFPSLLELLFSAPAVDFAVLDSCANKRLLDR